MRWRRCNRQACRSPPCTMCTRGQTCPGRLTGCLRTGTRTLEIPNSLAEACAAVAEGKVVDIDLGRAVPLLAPHVQDALGLYRWLNIPPEPRKGVMTVDAENSTREHPGAAARRRTPARGSLTGPRRATVCRVFGARVYFYLATDTPLYGILARGARSPPHLNPRLPLPRHRQPQHHGAQPQHHQNHESPVRLVHAGPVQHPD